MARYEYKSVMVYCSEYSTDIDQACNNLVNEGFFVFSVICPDPRNSSTYRLTAVRNNESGVTPLMFKEMM